jgi:hypothetical protein
MNTSTDHLDRLKEVTLFGQQALIKFIFRQCGYYNRISRELEEDLLEHDLAD